MSVNPLPPPLPVTGKAVDVYPDADLTQSEADEVDAAFTELAWSGTARLSPSAAAKLAHIRGDHQAALERIAYIVSTSNESNLILQIRAIVNEALKTP